LISPDDPWVRGEIRVSISDGILSVYDVLVEFSFDRDSEDARNLMNSEVFKAEESSYPK
jgi:hypothetical protein